MSLQNVVSQISALVPGLSPALSAPEVSQMTNVASGMLAELTANSNGLTPTEQLLSLLPKLVTGPGALSGIVSHLPNGLVETLLNSPYGPAVIDILTSQVGNRPLEYDDLLMSIFPIPVWAKTGTGVMKIVSMAHDIVGFNLPQSVINLVLTTQYNIYGGFPTPADVAPSAVFVAVNVILMAAHFYIFFRGFLRRHYFWPSFGLGWQCILNCLGFGMRIGWGKNLLSLRLGIASTVFIILSIILINSMNLLLAHRIMTFRHPETGDATWFGMLMILVYLAIGGVLLLAVVTEVTIFSYFLDYTHWRQATGGMQAASVLIAVISVGGVFIIAIAYALPRGSLALSNQDRSRLPASNIESYGIFYFPPKFSQVLQYKGDPTAKISSGKLAARVINGRDLNFSASLIVITSVILCATSGMRAATTFIGDRWSHHNKPIFSPTLFYVGFGVFECICNVLYLVARVDLRFYIPDMPRKGYGPILVDPETMQYTDPYTDGRGVVMDEKKGFTDHVEDVINVPAPTYNPAYALSPQVAMAARAMNASQMPPLPKSGPPPPVNKHTDFQEAQTLPPNSSFVEPPPIVPPPMPHPTLIGEPKMLYTPQMVPPPRMTPSNTSPRGSLKGSPKLISPEGSPKLPPQAPTLPKVSMGSPTLPNINMDSPNFGSRSAPKTEMVSPTIPNISHSPAAPLSMPRHSPLPSHAPQLPEILPTPFPQTPYQIRTATPPEFATPTNILPPVSPQHFPEPSFTPVEPGSSGHYARPYEEPEDEFRFSRDSENM
ncbi:YALIA101S01e09208g1_1 [Yarrowia lipolytica]|nr:YALIA101S01e09208g1_1 [Yarrowia lipolytica]